MKKQFLRGALFPTTLLSLIVLSIFFSPSLFVQDATSFMNEANAQIRSIGSILYQVVIAVLGLIALVSLINIGVRLQSADREGTNKAIGWTGGLIFCIVMALVLKNYLGL